MRITLVISSLSSGGAERVMSTMANYWAMEGHSIRLITFSSIGLDFYKLHPLIERISLTSENISSNALMGLWNNFIRIRKLRQAIKSSYSDIIICFVDKTNVATLIASRFLNRRVIISERTDPRYHNIGQIWSLLRRITYRWADFVVVQTDEVGIWMCKILNSVKVRVIPNPVQPPLNDIKARDASNSKGGIIAIGRLTPEKGFDFLIKAYSRVVRNNPDWNLTILGDGPERRSLLQLVEALGLTSKVFLPGRVKDPTTFLKNSDIFVLSSLYEGFPNVLLEAMACEVPVIATDCPSGPREIIRDGIDGILVPPKDENGLATAIDRMIQDESMRIRLATNARKAIDRFSVVKIMNIWGDLIAKTITAKPLRAFDEL